MEDAMLNVGTTLLSEINRNLQNNLINLQDNSSCCDISVDAANYTPQQIATLYPNTKILNNSRNSSTNSKISNRMSEYKPLAAPRKNNNLTKMSRPHCRTRRHTDEYDLSDAERGKISKKNPPSSSTSLSSSTSSTNINTGDSVDDDLSRRHKRRGNGHKRGENGNNAGILTNLDRGLDKFLIPPQIKENVIICNSKNVNMKYKDRTQIASDSSNLSKKSRIYLILYVIIITVMVFLIAIIILYTIYR